MTQQFVVPVARLLLQNGEAGSDGLTSFAVFESTPQKRGLSGSVSFTVDEKNVLQGELQAELRFVTPSTMSQFRPDTLCSLELGYLTGNLGPRTVFWGFIEDILPSRRGPERVYKITAKTAPWSLTNVGTNYSAENVSALTVLKELLGSVTLTLIENEHSAVLAGITLSDWTSTKSIARCILTLFDRVHKLTGKYFQLVPELSGQLNVRLIQISQKRDTTQTLNVLLTTNDRIIPSTSKAAEGVSEVVNLDLDFHAFNSADTAAKRTKQEELVVYDSNFGILVNPGTGGRVDLRDPTKIVTYEYDISTPTDPRIVIGQWVRLSGLPVGDAPQPAVFNVLHVSHNFGNSWETAYGGPMLGPTIPLSPVEA